MKIVLSVLALSGALALAGCGSLTDPAQQSSSQAVGACTTFFGSRNSQAIHRRYGSASRPPATWIEDWKEGCAPVSDARR